MYVKHLLYYSNTRLIIGTGIALQLVATIPKTFMTRSIDQQLRFVKMASSFSSFPYIDGCITNSSSEERLHFFLAGKETNTLWFPSSVKIKQNLKFENESFQINHINFCCSSK